LALEKGRVATMTRALFPHKKKDALHPMRKAAMDALLLSAFIFIGFFIFPQIILHDLWVLLPIYALTYLLMVLFRLRQAARKTAEAQSQEQASPHEYQAGPFDIYTAFTFTQAWSREKERPPPEEY
jgi:hypothetical protein